MKTGMRYIVQAVTFADGKISRVLAEQTARSQYSAECAATGMHMDLALLESGASIHINYELMFGNYLSPDAPRDLRTACRNL